MTNQSTDAKAATASDSGTVLKEKQPSDFQRLLDAEASKGELVPIDGAMPVQDPENIVPIQPNHLTEEHNAEIMARAEELAQAIFRDPSSLEVTSQVYAIGEACMTSNTQHVELMDTKIGPVLAEVTTEAAVPKTLTQITAQLNLVNPTIVGTEEVEAPADGFFNKLLSRTTNVVVANLPGGRQKIMEIIVERRDTVKTTVDTLRGHLFAERDKALQNAIQLGMIANNLRDTQEELQEAIYLGSLVWQRLNQLRNDETDPARQQALMFLVNDLSGRVNDLQMVDNLSMQSRMGAESLINNCRGINTLVNRVSNILLPSVMNALMVKAAAAQQAQLARASRDIMKAAGDTMHQTAKDIRQVTTDTAQMNAEAMLDLDQLEASCGEFYAMVDDVTEIITNAEANARGISNRLGKMNERIRNRVDPMTAARQARDQVGA